MDDIATITDFCTRQAFGGVLYPCARSFATNSRGPSSAMDVLVQWDWKPHYYLRDSSVAPSEDNTSPTGKALEEMFGGTAPVTFAAMIIPDRNVVWVPFTANRQPVKPGEVEQYQRGHTYELKDVVFIDKAGIWVERTLRLTT